MFLVAFQRKYLVKFVPTPRRTLVVRHQVCGSEFRRFAERRCRYQGNNACLKLLPTISNIMSSSDSLKTELQGHTTINKESIRHNKKISNNAQSMLEKKKSGKKNSSKSKSKKKKSKKASDPTKSITYSFSKLEISHNQQPIPNRLQNNRPIRRSYSTHSAGPTHSKRNEQFSLQEIVKYIISGRAKNIVVMCGAGISTASGIPDFRTPGTGLYDNLQRYKIPFPTAVFDANYFQTNPRPFFELAKELYPTGKYRPSSAHYFLRALHEKGLLLRVYTQNIDGLERIAGIPPSKLVEAHGTFSSASCVKCGKKYNGEEIKAKIFKGAIPRCQLTPLCYGIVKPDIVFFGEDLPQRFYYYVRDFPVCDMLIIMGTSLEVEPFASLVESTRYNIPRVLLNRERVGPFVKRSRGRPKDHVITGELPDIIGRLVAELGWEDFVEDLTTENEKASANTEKLCSDSIDVRGDSGVSSASSISSKDSDEARPRGVKASIPPVGTDIKRYFHTIRSTPLPKPNSCIRSSEKFASGDQCTLDSTISSTNISYYDFIKKSSSLTKPTPTPLKPPHSTQKPKTTGLNGKEILTVYSKANSRAPTIQYAQKVKPSKAQTLSPPKMPLNRKNSTISLPNFSTHITDDSSQSESSGDDTGCESSESGT